MLYKMVQAILGLMKRENLIVVAVAKRELIANGPFFSLYTPLPRLSFLAFLVYFPRYA